MDNDDDFQLRNCALQLANNLGVEPAEVVARASVYLDFLTGKGSSDTIAPQNYGLIGGDPNIYPTGVSIGNQSTIAGTPLHAKPPTTPYPIYNPSN